MSRRLPRAVAAAAAMLGVLCTAASPAAAHTITGSKPTNYKSALFSLSPSVPGIQLELRDLGRQVQVTNKTSVDLVVMGYDREPYLKVGPAGTFENRRSPTLYRNQTGVTAPADADPRAPAEWRRTGDGDRLRWRDQRTRWEGPAPPQVKADPRVTRVVSQWTIPMLRADQPLAATGLITWVPPPSAVPWLLLALGLLLATAALGWARRWGPLLAIALATLIAVDVVHSFASGAAAGDAVVVMVAKVLLGNLPATISWAGGVWAVAVLRRNSEVGLLVAGLAGFVMGVYALSDTSVLGRSELPYVFPAVTDRAAVATVLGIGLGMVPAAVAVFKRNPSLVTRAADSPS